MLAFILTLSSTPLLAAECLFAYKAKRDNPLQLHYGVMAINGQCDLASVKQEVAQRLEANGWALLVLLEQLPPSKVDEYKETAGAYFLRY